MNNKYVLKLQQKINEQADDQITKEGLSMQLSEKLTEREKILFNNGELNNIPCILYSLERLDQTGLFYLVSTYEDRQAMSDNGAINEDELLLVEESLKKVHGEKLL